MKIKHLFVALLTVTALWSCGDDYDDTALRNDVDDLKSRVEKLETWCTTVNGQISALQGLVIALEDKDYVTGVSPLPTNDGYTITFSKNEAITIYNGKDGANGANGITPVVGVNKDADGFYYWTVKVGDAEAKWLTDAAGKKIRTTGDAGAEPKISVAADTDGKLYWQVNGKWLMNGTDKVPATGDKGETGATGSQGDAVFAANGVKVNEDNVEFTLADGTTKFTLPRVSEIKIFDTFDEIEIDVATQLTEVTLALNIKKDNFAAIKAELTSEGGTTTKITRATPIPWEVSITSPVFGADGNVTTQPVVSITPKDGSVALLKVTVIDKEGKEHAATRVISIPAFANEGEAGIDGSNWDKAYEIETLKQFKLLAARVNMDNSPWTAKYYKLTADIDFGADNTEAWPTIGYNYQHAFKGHFDGGNHIVKGKLIAATGTMFFGIFGQGTGAEIKNLHFKGSMENTSKVDAMGSIMSFENDATGIIVNCSNTAIINAAGTCGIVYSSKGKVIACVNSGALSASTSSSSFGIGDANCIGCINKGSITAGFYVVGIAQGRYPVVACWSSATNLQATGDSPIIGGIVGKLFANDFKACYWKEIAGVEGVGDLNGKTATDFASFTGDHPTADQIAKMNAVWAEAQPSGREYKFNDATGEIEKIVP